MKKKEFEHTIRTKEYIMTYLLSVPAGIQRNTRQVTKAVDEAMYRDSFKPARSIGYLLRQLVDEGKVIRFNEQNWEATRNPFAGAFAVEETVQAFDDIFEKIMAASEFLADVATIVLEMKKKIKPKEKDNQKNLLDEKKTRNYPDPSRLQSGQVDWEGLR